MYKLSPQQKKLISITIKLMVLVLTLVYLYKRLFIQKKFDSLVDGFNFTITSNKILLLIALVLLMLINWGIETYKWQKLMNKLEDVSFWQAYKAILAGITVSFFTPNRVGEFMGRIIFIRKSSKLKAILGTVTGSFAQLICTAVFGAVGVAWYYNQFIDISEIAQPLLFTLIALLLLVFYFNIALINRLFEKFKIKKVARYTAILSRYKLKDLSVVLLLSAIRYAVFAFQYVIIFYFFDINVGILNSLGAVSIIFLAQAFIPSIGLSELGNRGAAVIYIFEVFSGVNELALLASAYGLWVLNIVIPSLLGLIFILKTKIYPKA